MIKEQLVNKIAEQTGATKKATEAFINAFIKVVKEEVNRGEKHGNDRQRHRKHHDGCKHRVAQQRCDHAFCGTAANSNLSFRINGNIIILFQQPK